MNQPEILYPLQTPEQSKNTHLFLAELVADCYGTGDCCMILRQNILTRTTYVHYRDEMTGKLRTVYTEDPEPEKKIKGRKGKDWNSPALYELATDKELLKVHLFPFAHKEKIDGETEWVRDLRLPLPQTVAESDETQKYLFCGALVRYRSVIQQRVAKNGNEYWQYEGFKTTDVTFGRCLWVDVDGHDQTLDDIKKSNPIAVEHLMQLLPNYCQLTGVPMPAVINSGRGVHLYWWFQEAVDLGDQQAKNKFKLMLGQMNRWISALIKSDEVCSAIWKVDRGSCAILHQMCLPGCIHPKTLTPRYVVNAYGVDYTRISYDELCDLMGVDTLIAETPAKPDRCVAGPKQTAPATQNKPDAPKEQPTTPTETPHTDAEQDETPNNAGRLQRLMDWANGRGWDLYPGRENFLFICGAIIQQYAKGKMIPERNHPLYAINRKLTMPLMEREVTKIIRTLNDKAKNGTDPYSRYYLYTNEGIADSLKMTPKEKEKFLNTTVVLSYGTMPSFGAKRREFLQTEPWHMERESLDDHRARCYQMTCDWFDENRRCENRNLARTRRRAAKQGYNPNGGRPQVDHTADAQKCKQLHAQGMTIRNIADTLGISKSTVGRLIKT